MSSSLRIIDANANRAREALRVMEDAARFALNNTELSAALKQLRHDLAAALSTLPNLAVHRDTPGDVGTVITTPAEQSRAGLAEVAIAAGKRLSEALRSMEEFAKTLPPEQSQAAVAFEQLRYRGYAVEQSLNTALAAGRAKQWRLCLLLTESLCRLPWRDVLDQALDAGVDCVQLREKELEANELLEQASYLAERCRSAGAASIINDRPDIATLSNADGVHLGQTDLPPEAVRKLVGNQLFIGVSTASLVEAYAAQAAGADYVGLGPMFPTTTKHKPVIAGPEYLRSYLVDEKINDFPHLAIGGITPENLPQLVGAGVRGIAASSIICGSEQPGKTAEHLLSILKPDHG